MSERRSVFQSALLAWLSKPNSKSCRRDLERALAAWPPARGWPPALHHAVQTARLCLQQAQAEQMEALAPALGWLDMAVRDLDEALAARVQAHCLNALRATPSATSVSEDAAISEAWPPQLPEDASFNQTGQRLVLRARLGAGHLLLCAQRVMAVMPLRQALARPDSAPAWLAGHYEWRQRRVVVVDGLHRAKPTPAWLCVVRPPMAASAVVGQFALAVDDLPSVGRVQDQGSVAHCAPDLAALAAQIEHSGYG